MRRERWYWLPVFCFVSLLVHLGLVYESRSFALPMPPVRGAEIEITLDDTPTPTPKPAPAPTPKKPDAKPAARSKPAAKPAPVSPAPTKTAEAPPRTARPIKTASIDLRKTAVDATTQKSNLGGMERLIDETPLSAGLPSKSRERLTRTAIGKASAPTFGGGGSPAPSFAPGHDGSPAPEIGRAHV